MMRSVRLVILAAVLATLGRAGVTGSQGARAERLRQGTSCAPSIATQSGVSFTKLVSAENGFGFRLLNVLLGKTPTSNTFISPTSVSMALGMAYDGARGTSAQAMAGTLGIDDMSQTAARQQAASFLNHLQTSGNGGGLFVANSLWARQGISFKSAFLQDARGDYGAAVRTLDFKSASAPGTINKWVACATEGKITSIISRIRIDEILFLINAVYFHGDWANTFDPSATHARAFATAAGARVQIPLMSRIGTYAYYKGSNFQLISLPYTNPRFSMVVVLPGSGVSPASFGRQVTAANWSRWTSRMRDLPGSLAFPRFSLKNSFTLNGALGSLGMAGAFSRSANFSGICLQQCRLTEVRHKTYLAVNERGTVAAAVTSVGVGVTAMPVAKFQMVVDRPFFLSIQDSRTGAILFTGMVADPAG